MRRSKLAVTAVEFHTGTYADAVTPAEAAKQLTQLQRRRRTRQDWACTSTWATG